MTVRRFEINDYIVVESSAISGNEYGFIGINKQSPKSPLDVRLVTVTAKGNVIANFESSQLLGEAALRISTGAEFGSLVLDTQDFTLRLNLSEIGEAGIKRFPGIGGRLFVSSPSYFYVFPGSAGQVGQVLATDGAGNLFWQAVGGGTQFGYLSSIAVFSNQNTSQSIGTSFTTILLSNVYNTDLAAITISGISSIKILESGYWYISFSCSYQNLTNARTHVESALFQGTVHLSATSTFSYHRNAANGFDTGSRILVLYASANTEFSLRARKIGTGSIQTLPSNMTITFVKVRP